jgi:hypothetical protein
MSLKLHRLPSLAYASGFQMLCNSGFETASRSYARQSEVFHRLATVAACQFSPDGAPGQFHLQVEFSCVAPHTGRATRNSGCHHRPRPLGFLIEKK